MTKFKIVNDANEEIVTNYTSRAEAEANAERLGRMYCNRFRVVEYEAPAIIRVRVVGRGSLDDLPNVR